MSLTNIQYKTKKLQCKMEFTTQKFKDCLLYTKIEQRK